MTRVLCGVAPFFDLRQIVPNNADFITIE